MPKKTSKQPVGIPLSGPQRRLFDLRLQAAHDAYERRRDDEDWYRRSGAEEASKLDYFCYEECKKHGELCGAVRDGSWAKADELFKRAKATLPRRQQEPPDDPYEGIPEWARYEVEAEKLKILKTHQVGGYVGLNHYLEACDEARARVLAKYGFENPGVDGDTGLPP